MARIAVFAPHPDDAEIGMGGTIALLVSQGHDVVIVDVTDGCPTPVGDRPTRIAEAAAALRALTPAAGGTLTRALLDLPNRRVEHTLEARHLAASAIRSHQATILFCPHPDDAHPDHRAVTRIVDDARFDAKLTALDVPRIAGMPPVGPPLYPRWVFYYFCSHLRAVFQPDFIVDISAHVDAKRRALEAYRTQFALNPVNTGILERLDAAQRFYGSRINVAAGEPFAGREPLGLTGLASVAGV